MEISHFNEKQFEIRETMDRFIEAKRPPEEIRDQLDLAYRIDGSNIIIFEVRPQFQAPEKKLQLDVAKATFVKKNENWKVYWKRSDLKWHAYTPAPVVHTLKEFIALVDEDAHSRFFG